MIIVNHFTTNFKYHRLQVQFQIPSSLKEFYNPKLSKEQIKNHLKSVHEVKLNPEQVRFIEKSTVLHSNSIVWKSLRAGQITASNVHEVFHTDQNDPAKSLV